VEPGKVVRPDDAEDVMWSLDRGRGEVKPIVVVRIRCGSKQMEIEKLQ
jgi:hypothetical protein